jgi:phosphotransferase system HPr (HPr) family protein
MTIVNRQGWLARPSALVVKCAHTFRSDVSISINGQVANGKSMMEVIMLASPCGSVVEIEATGPDADACADALENLISSGFGEELA